MRVWKHEVRTDAGITDRRTTHHSSKLFAAVILLDCQSRGNLPLPTHCVDSCRGNMFVSIRTNQKSRGACLEAMQTTLVVHQKCPIADRCNMSRAQRAAFSTKHTVLSLMFPLRLAYIDVSRDEIISLPVIRTTTKPPINFRRVSQQ
jgi:hypothetical protein